MERTVVIALVNNAALLLVLSVVYEVPYYISDKYYRIRPFIRGLLISLICVAIMSAPLTIQPGIVYDTRSILISVTGLIFGLIPTLITVATAVIIRVIRGGSGMVPGLMVILSSALIGLIWRQWVYPRVHKARWLSIYLMSLIVHAVMIACMLLLPYPDNLNIIRQITAPVMLIYPIATVLLNLLLIRQKQLRQGQTQLKQSEERFELLFEQAPLGYQSLNRDGSLLQVNEKWLNMFGYTRSEVIGQWFGSFLAPESKTRFELNFPQFIESGQTNIEHVVQHKNGRQMIISFEGRVAFNADGSFKQTHCILQDITERKQTETALRQSEEKYRRITDHISDVVWTTDLNMKTTFVSPSIERLVGDSVEDHLKKTVEEKFPPASIARLSAILKDELENDHQRDKDRSRVFELEHYKADGSIIWLGMNVSIIRNQKGQPTGFLGVSRDISSLKKTQEHLEHLIDHDDLTGIYNRRRYEKEIERLNDENQLPLSIIIADINGLKLINDSFGYSEGDNIIALSAKLISSGCRDGDVLARTGGDEFTLLLPKTDTPAALEIIETIQQACDQYNATVENDAFHINLSFGATTRKNLADSFIQVHRRAEDYLNQSKLLKKNSANSAIIASIKATMQEKSDETEAHSARLAQLARTIGKRLELSQIEMDHIELLATLHDIGKIGVSEQVLKKPGKLNSDEWKEMKKHPEIGYRIAMSSPHIAPIAEFILHHHERWDGTGYPQQLQGSDIPLLSRIIAVADAYDAMTADRVYRKAISHEEAIAEIKRCAGTQFDPEIATLFVNVMKNERP